MNKIITPERIVIALLVVVASWFYYLHSVTKAENENLKGQIRSMAESHEQYKAERYEEYNRVLSVLDSVVNVPGWKPGR